MKHSVNNKIFENLVTFDVHFGSKFQWHKKIISALFEIKKEIEYLKKTKTNAVCGIWLFTESTLVSV